MAPQAIMILIAFLFLTGTPVTRAQSSVRITEFMAANSLTLDDEDGDSSDWIEIHNAGPVSQSLSGWYLTDNENNLTKWQFPAGVNLDPDQFLIVFASGKDRTNSFPLHTSFKLSSGGEYLALVDAEGIVISVFAPTFPPQSTDVSYCLDEFGVPDFCDQPTPGASNTTVVIYSPPVRFSARSGTFVEPFDLELSVPPGVEIRFTTSTNLPDLSSPLYTGPIPITGSTVIRARAFVPELLPGPPRTEHFFQLNPNAVGFTSDLPITILHNFGGGSVPASGEQYVAMMIFEPQANGRSSVTNAPDLATAGYFRRRGADTLNYPKGSFRFEAWDEFFDDKQISPLGMPPESDWVLHAPNNFEPALIHNPLASRLSQDVGRYAPRTRSVEVLLKDDSGLPGSIDLPTPGTGDYNGIYVFMETIKIDPNRVDIDKLQPTDVEPLAVTGGYLWRIDRRDPGDSGFTGAGQGSLNHVDPSETEIETAQRDPQQQYVLNYFNLFGAALYGDSYRDRTSGYRRYIDVEAAVDHHILNLVMFNVDALRLGCYLYKGRDRTNEMGELLEGKITFGPVWDFDRALGSTDGRDFNPTQFRATTSDRGTDFFNYVWWNRMFTDPDFWQAWIDRYQQLRDGPLSTAHIFSVLEDMFDELREAEPRERARWGVLPRSGIVTGSGYSFDFGMREFDSELRFKRQWFSDRLDFIDGNLLPRPVLSHPGGAVTVGQILSLAATPGSDIYYTLDGTDPRGEGGTGGSVGLAPGAIRYTGLVVLDATGRLVARAWNPLHNNLTGANNPPITSHWSGRREALYYVRTLAVTELMYNPGYQESGTGFYDEDFEFIELRNIGPAPLDLSGATFTRGISFTFANTVLAPGERIVVVRNADAFALRYGTEVPIAGSYSNLLSNQGERLTLEGRFGEPMVDLTYDAGWFPITGGHGFSLVPVDDTTVPESYDRRDVWRPCRRRGGSPGAADPPPFPIAPVLVNEVLSHASSPLEDAVEFFNPNAVAADVSHWYLTDKFYTPKKIQLPKGTVIPAGGFMALDEHFFNPVEPPKPGSFAFNSGGDEVYLFSAGEDGELTGYVHGFSFGAAEPNVSFGRHVTGTGEEHFVAQNAITWFEPNVGPRVGPVVISEVMYHPPDPAEGSEAISDEYIELCNISGGAVGLFDPVFPTNNWRLRNAVEFEFPPGTAMAPGSCLLVVGFNPVTDPAKLAAFRIRNQVPANVPILGPWSGTLNDSGDSIELCRPDTSDPTDITYPLVERVDYGQDLPWPAAANGFGPSLRRIDTAQYGNDPGNWVAARISPGNASGGGIAPVVLSHPTNVTTLASLDATFRVRMRFAGRPYEYQWTFEDSILPGATNDTLTLNSVHPRQSGRYKVLVWNGTGAVTSSNAVLSVLHNVATVRKLTGETVTLDVEFTNVTTIAYQWRKNGAPIAGATNSTVTLTNLQPADAAIYDVVQTDFTGSMARETTFLMVLGPPTIVYPAGSFSLEVPQGSSITLGLTVTNNATLPVTYRWRRGGTTVAIRELAHRTDFFTIPDFQEEDVGTYTCVVTNEAFYAPGYLGGRTTLSLGPPNDTDGDGMADDYEVAHGLDPGVADGELDPDMDRYTNLEEYIAGTDPRDGESFLKIESIDRGSVVIRFFARPGRTYAVQYRDGDVTAGPWQFLGGLPASQEPTHMVEIVDPGPPFDTPRYYRLVTPGASESVSF